jgi:hypothetical protein
MWQHAPHRLPMTSVVLLTFTPLKAEFSVFEATNKRTNNLDTCVLFNTFKTIKPSSVASERPFSISGNFVSKIRTRLSHRSVDFYVF